MSWDSDANRQMRDTSISTQPSTSEFRETEIGMIPMDWDLRPIKAFSKVILGKTPPTKESSYWDDGTIPFITPGDMQMYGGVIRHTERAITEKGLEAARPLPRGTVVVSCIGNIGKVGVVDIEVATTNQQLNSIIPDEKQADNWYVAYAMMSLTPVLESRARMTTVPILNKTNFQEVPVPLPPLPEQRRIAAALRTIQDAIAAQDDVIAAARELKRSLMARLFTYGPGPDPAPTQETEIGEIPEHWDLVQLKNIADKPQYGYTESASEDPVGPKFLRITDITDSGVSWATVPYCECSDEDREKYQLDQGDIVFARTGATTGKSYLIKQVPDEAIFASYLIRVRVNEDINPAYLYAYFTTSSYWQQITQSKSGSAQAGVNASRLSNLQIPLAPQIEQERIAQVLACADAKIIAEEQRKAALNELFRATLEQLMTGQLRLPA